MINKIWQRYVLKQVLQLFFALLFAFYLLYILIDYSSNTRDFADSQLGFRTFIVYYLCHFSKQLHLLVPLALLVSVIRTLCAMNTSHELTALMANGLRRKTFMRPFILIGLVCTAFLYANLQWVLPGSLTLLNRLTDQYFQASQTKQAHVHSLALRDRSVLLYQSFDSARKCFFDCYWIVSTDEVYRIKHLHPEATESLGQQVDHLKRDEEGRMVQLETHAEKIFPELGFDDDVIGSAVVDAENLSISRLWELLPNRSHKHMTEREALMLSTLHSKLAIPWLCLLVVIAPAPFCTYFTRQLPVFFLFAVAIAGFVVFLTLFDAMSILAEGLVLPPLLAVWSPFIPFYGYFSYKYVKEL